MIIHHKLFSVIARTCLQIDIRRIMYYIKRQEKEQQQQQQYQQQLQKMSSDIPKDK